MQIFLAANDDDEEDLELNNPLDESTFQYDTNVRSTSSIQRNLNGDTSNNSSNGNAGGSSSSRRSMTIRMAQHQMENVRPGQMVKTTEFWILWLTFFLNSQAIGYINSMYKVNKRKQNFLQASIQHIKCPIK